ncbi:hypothetical protein [Streptomyces sp. x-19]|uniref:hypothetical protein n=1 Tax=Streptomyces sp. x-19 TaxID=2789280 RepID=UPI00397F313F
MRYTAPLSTAQAEQLGKDIGTIIGLAAKTISAIRGDVDADEVMRTLTSSTAIDVTTARYLKALEEGRRPEAAAAAAGTALVFDWADAVLETRNRLRRKKTTMAEGANQ